MRRPSLRPAALLLVAALVAPVSSLAAQSCGLVPPPRATPRATPALKALGLALGVGTVAGLDSTLGDVIASEIGGAYHRVLPGKTVLPPTAIALATVEAVRGFLDVRDVGDGELDKKYVRVGARVTAQQPVPKLKGLHLCGAVGASVTVHTFPTLPRTVTRIPLAFGGAYAYQWGGVVFTPGLELALGYQQSSRWVSDTADVATIIGSDRNAGLDWGVFAGTSIRFGRGLLGVGYRLRDAALNDSGRLEMAMTSWF